MCTNVHILIEWYVFDGHDRLANIIVLGREPEIG